MSAVRIDIERKAFAGSGPGESSLVIDQLRLDVADGEFVCLVGPSGCGKSTLLNVVSGLDRDYAGSIDLGPHEARAGPACGYVFQSPRLMPWLRVVDNVRLVVDEHAGSDDRVHDVLRDVGLADVADSYPGQLSGGMLRRVALARAFVNAPRLLLLDEPFVSLDQPAAEALRGLLLSLCENRAATVIFVTHDLREALELADRVVFLSARPARTLLDYTVPLERPRRIADGRVEQVREALLAAHPGLLAGGGGAPEGAPPTIAVGRGGE